MSGADESPSPGVGSKVSVRQIRCKRDAKVTLRPAERADFQALCAMFDTFEPKESVQGLPPADPQKRAEWVEQMMTQPVNALAENDGRPVGHACLLEIDPGERGELEIMVHQDWQNRGIGSALLDLLCDLAQARGIHRIWLCVDARNSRAIRIYRNSGFALIGPLDVEIEMERRLW